MSDGRRVYPPSSIKSPSAFVPIFGSSVIKKKKKKNPISVLKNKSVWPFFFSLQAQKQVKALYPFTENILLTLVRVLTFTGHVNKYFSLFAAEQSWNQMTRMQTLTESLNKWAQSKKRATIDCCTVRSGPRLVMSLDFKISRSNEFAPIRRVCSPTSGSLCPL